MLAILEASYDEQLFGRHHTSADGCDHAGNLEVNYWLGGSGGGTGDAAFFVVDLGEAAAVGGVELRNAHNRWHQDR